MNKSLPVIIAVIVLVIGIPVYLLARSSDSTPENSSTSIPQTSTPATSTNLITYTNTGFVPTTLTIKSGNQVSIKNDSSRELQFDSDPHPDHTDNPELNIGSIPGGETKTFTVNRTGTHGYHNHKNDSDRGTLIVQ